MNSYAGRRYPVTWLHAPMLERMAAEMAWHLRGINRHDGAGLLEAIQERFEHLAHRLQGIRIE
jgi:hypothetical protein